MGMRARVVEPVLWAPSGLVGSFPESAANWRNRGIRLSGLDPSIPVIPAPLGCNRVAVSGAQGATYNRAVKLATVRGEIECQQTLDRHWGNYQDSLQARLAAVLGARRAFMERQVSSDGLTLHGSRAARMMWPTTPALSPYASGTPSWSRSKYGFFQGVHMFSHSGS